MVVPQPRAENTTPEQNIEPQFIVECPTEAAVKSLKRPIHNYISQYEEGAPTQNTQSRNHIQHTITQEAILSATESTSSAPTARQCAS